MVVDQWRADYVLLNFRIPVGLWLLTLRHETWIYFNFHLPTRGRIHPQQYPILTTMWRKRNAVRWSLISVPTLWFGSDYIPKTAKIRGTLTLHLTIKSLPTFSPSSESLDILPMQFGCRYHEFTDTFSILMTRTSPGVCLFSLNKFSLEKNVCFTHY